MLLSIVHDAVETERAANEPAQTQSEAPQLLDLLFDPTLDLAAHFHDDEPTPTLILKAA
jgi:hypothetical protein